MKTVLIVGGLLIAAAFLFGFIPQYLTAGRLRDDVHSRDLRIAQLQQDAELSKARDLASLLYLDVNQKNYGIAGQHATAFFDQIRRLINGTPDAAARTKLESIAAQRD